MNLSSPPPSVSNNDSHIFSTSKKRLLIPTLLFCSISLANAAVSPNYGGTGGSAFSDTASSNTKLTSIKLRTGSWIDSIQGIPVQGTLPAHGGNGGSAVAANWPANEYLVRAYGTYNQYLGQISFVTNTGRVVGPFGNPTYPKKLQITWAWIFPIFKYVPNFKTFDYTVAAGNTITGFSGRAGAYIDAVAIQYNPLVSSPTPAPTPAPTPVPTPAPTPAPTPVPTTTPDLAISVAQPIPALTATALSELPVTVNNIGNKATTGNIILTFTLPSGITAPLKFARNADAWVCLNAASTLTCTYNKTLASGGGATNLRIPITPNTTTIGLAPGPFTVKVAATTGETNTANNTASAPTLTTAVKSLTLASITDPNYSQPLLDPTAIPKYALPLPNAFASFFRHTPNTVSTYGSDSYTLDIKKIDTHILPPGFPATPVFAYGDPAKPDTFSYPAHTIVANSVAAGLNSFGVGRPVKLKFLDTRTDVNHLIPIDHSIHGAMAGEPDIRSIAHLHGIKNINQNSDGYPESWISPSGKNGNQFVAKSTLTVPINPNPNDYGNNQEGTLLWFHDHSLGLTRLNVYAGLAGLYLLRDSNEQTMINNNTLPNGAYEIPLVIQDRMFHPDGTLAYPDLNPGVLNSPTPSLLPEFFGNVMVVNGVAWPFQEVEPRKYRFRVLNGSGSRFYKLALSNNATFSVIGTEGGFLAAPTPVNTLTIGPAERYDIVIDFSTMNGQTITMTNSANTPFPNGAPINAGLDDQIMQFRVNLALSSTPNNPLPTSLRPGGVPVITPTVAAPRQVLLAETTDNYGRILPTLGTVTNGILGWMDTVTETPKAGSIETWEIYNSTIDAHPIHLHGGHFQIINRQPYSANQGGLNLALTGITFPSTAVLPSPAEKTWKDTVISYPGEVTRITVKFENTGLFVWHCHILEHEDHDMMRPMLVQ